MNKNVITVEQNNHGFEVTIDKTNMSEELLEECNRVIYIIARQFGGNYTYENNTIVSTYERRKQIGFKRLLGSLAAEGFDIKWL